MQQWILFQILSFHSYPSVKSGSNYRFWFLSIDKTIRFHINHRICAMSICISKVICAFVSSFLIPAPLHVLLCIRTYNVIFNSCSSFKCVCVCVLLPSLKHNSFEILLTDQFFFFQNSKTSERFFSLFIFGYVYV